MGGWGFTDDQFWSLTPTAFWWTYEAHLPPKKYGTLSEEDVQDILQVMEDAETKR